MNTTSYILSKEQYQQFAAGFTARARTKNISSGDMLLYNIIRNKDVHRGFTPITNPSKINHGMNAWQGFVDARQTLNQQIRWSKDQLKSKFGVEFTEETTTAILDVLKDAR